MKVPLGKFGGADRGLLPEGRLGGPMTWVIAIMMFLTVLAAAAGLGLRNAAHSLGADIGNRITIQIVEANPDFREAQARIAVSTLRRLTGVKAIRRIEASELERLLEPWLGAGGLEADLPVPVMIDVDLSPEAFGRLDVIRGAVRDVAPSARVDDNAQWLAPLGKLINALTWLATGLVLLMIGATAATVVLAARAALDTHRGTIEVLHLMGATDLQVARLFQRRIAIDALFGGAIGLAVGSLVLVIIGHRVAALGSELLGSTGLPLGNWMLLAALPIGGVLLAMLVARLTILRALGKNAVIRRLISLLLLVYLLGYAFFVVLLPRPADDRATDAIVVLTGGPGRINRGLQLLEQHRAKRMLISGVARTVRPVELAAENRRDAALFECCIDLGRESVDTRSNAEETARWLQRHKFKSVRLVTTDWHMPRASFELGRRVADDVSILDDAIDSDPSFRQLFTEYNKYLLRHAAVLVGI